MYIYIFNTYILKCIYVKHMIEHSVKIKLNLTQILTSRSIQYKYLKYNSEKNILNYTSINQKNTFKYLISKLYI